MKIIIHLNNLKLNIIYAGINELEIMKNIIVHIVLINSKYYHLISLLIIRKKERYVNMIKSKDNLISIELIICESLPVGLRLQL